MDVGSGGGVEVAVWVGVGTKRALVSSATLAWGFSGPKRSASKTINPMPITARAMLSQRKMELFSKRRFMVVDDYNW
jgi:hypothetical protein